MLTQSEADKLMKAAKRMLEQGIIELPAPGGRKEYAAESIGERCEFLFDVSVSGRITSNQTCQERVHQSIVLVRLDVDGPPHTNPDGKKISCPHLHIYCEGVETRWAYPVPKELMELGDSLTDIFTRFLQYCNVINTPHIQGGLDL